MGLIGGLLDWRARTSGDSTLAKPESWLVSFFGGGPSRSGQTVNAQTVTTLAVVWACVRALAEDTAKLPLKVYRRVEGDGREEVREHPAYPLLNVQANLDGATGFVLREWLMWGALLWGNGFAEIERTNAGRPMALWPMDPARTKLRRTKAGRIEYLYRNDDGRETVLPPEDVVHVRGPTMDGLVGYSVIAKARETFGEALATSGFAAAFWANSARPSGALTHPQSLSDKARANLRKSMEDLYAGASNAGRPMLLEEGLTWTPFSIPAKDAQFVETRQFDVEEICRWFRVPPHKVMKLDRSTNNNIEHQGIEYVTDGLGAWMRRLESEFNLKIFSPRERGELYVEHNADALQRGDLLTRYDAYGKARQWGWMSVNEIRRRENLNAIEGGDQYLVPVNMTTPAKIEEAPVAAATTPAPSVGAGGEDNDERAGLADAIGHAVVPILREAVFRALEIESDRARRAAKRGVLATWVDEYYRDHDVHVRGLLMAGLEAAQRFAARCGLDVPETFVADVAGQIVACHCRASAEAVRGVAAGEAEALETVLKGWGAERADRDAEAYRRLVVAGLLVRTEVT